MSERLQMCLWFGAGVLMQAMFLVGGRWTWKNAWICFSCGLIGMCPGKHEEHYLQNIYIHTLFGFMAFAFTVASVYRKYLLPRINEIFVLSYTMTAWYALFSFCHNSFLLKATIGLFIFPTAATFFIAFWPKDLSEGWKVFFYMWFLCVIITIGLMQLQFRNMIFFTQDGHFWIDRTEIVFSGMAFTYLCVNLSHIWHLVPLTRKNQSWASRKEEIKRYMGFLEECYGSYQLTKTQALGLIVLQGGILTLNYFHPVMSKNLMVNFFILAPSLVALAGRKGQDDILAETAEGDASI